MQDAGASDLKGIAHIGGREARQRAAPPTLDDHRREQDRPLFMVARRADDPDGPVTFAHLLEA
jgi:hypothetical protein